MTVIGVTGGMASGKTQVAKYFQELGANIIDADKIANKILSRRAIKEKIVSLFGTIILRGRVIDRAKLAQIVFKNRVSLKKLCLIIHPMVIKEIMQLVKRSRAKVVVIDAPLLIESGLYRKMDKVIVIKATRATQLWRSTDKGFSQKDALSRMRAQVPLSEKLRYADFVINSECTTGGTRKQVLDIWHQLT